MCIGDAYEAQPESLCDRVRAHELICTRRVVIDAHFRGAARLRRLIDHINVHAALAVGAGGALPASKEQRDPARLELEIEQVIREALGRLALDGDIRAARGLRGVEHHLILGALRLKVGHRRVLPAPAACGTGGCRRCG